MPSIIVSKKISFYRLEILYQKLNSKFDMMNWDDILDFIPLKDYVPVMNRGLNFDLETLKRTLKIPDTGSGNYSEKDIHYIRGGRRYGIEFFDTIDTDEKLQRYSKKFYISDLIKRNETLLHFGSLHGSNRIILKQPENIEFLRKVMKDLRFKHPILMDSVKRIIDELGGPRSFIGVHIRTGDGVFKNRKNKIINDIFDKMSNYSNSHNLTNNFLRKPLPNNASKNVLKCLERPESLVIYIATDEPKPKEAFESNLNSCIFVLSDFNDHLKPLNNLKFTPFFKSLVDLLVVSNGVEFIGTRRSTFSKLAKAIHEYQ
ncbi:9893_t:CDS:1 [Dentiscutata erythropus]|uniref:9893_t:CDS:1 n=1 Tax=Dentiscutata erythropus TaxID=1348616 RepID=A0A9N8ZBS5_9GLOM|nr:9893_t:CDS:1 [Dentiscutata erythropus]